MAWRPSDEQLGGEQVPAAVLGGPGLRVQPGPGPPAVTPGLRDLAALNGFPVQVQAVLLGHALQCAAEPGPGHDSLGEISVSAAARDFWP